MKENGKSRRQLKMTLRGSHYCQGDPVPELTNPEAFPEKRYLKIKKFNVLQCIITLKMLVIRVY